jgi:hypothetical protein
LIEEVPGKRTLGKQKCKWRNILIDNNGARYEVSMVLRVHIVTSCVYTPCSFGGIKEHFRGTCLIFSL